jgi:hypothetical protein
VAGGLLSTALSTFISNVVSAPQILFRFIIPVFLLLVMSVVYQRLSMYTKIDAPPTLEQMKEPFDLPTDRFNLEVKIIQSNNYDKYLTDIGSDFDVLKNSSEDFKRLMKAYRKYEAMSKSTYKKRKKRGEELKQQTFKSILDLYANVRRLKMERFELSSVKEGANQR